jgi:amphi-Trp domain-containing protein
MTEIEWERKIRREQAAKLLRAVADGLSGGHNVEIEQDGFELRVAVAEEIDVEIELEVEEGETEVELELKWRIGRPQGSDPDNSATSDAPSLADGSAREPATQEFDGATTAPLD